MKTKAFTLIEILIATMIFMTVAIMAVAAFAMVKRSNEITSDQAKTDECSRQVENFIGSVFRSASFGSPRVMALVRVRVSGQPKLKFLSGTADFIDTFGFVVLEKTASDDQVNITYIFKNIDINDAKQTGYFYKSLIVNKSDIKDGMVMTDYISFTANPSPQKIHSNECIPLKINGEQLGFAGRYKNPFSMKLSYPYEGGPASQIGNPIYSLVLNDLFFSKFSAQDKDDKSLSKLYVEVTNNIKPI